MNIISFDTFCERIAEKVGISIDKGDRGYHMVFDEINPNPRFSVEFYDFGNGNYNAEFFLRSNRTYHSSISYGEGHVEHFENACSPTHEYDDEHMPIGKSVQNIYYEGKQIAAAVRSLKKGNELFDRRKPIYYW